MKNQKKKLSEVELQITRLENLSGKTFTAKELKRDLSRIIDLREFESERFMNGLILVHKNDDFFIEFESRSEDRRALSLKYFGQKPRMNEISSAII